MSDEEPSTSKGRSLHTDDIMQLFASDDEGSFSGFEIDKNNNNLADDILDQAQASQNMSTLPQCSNKLTGSAKGTRKRKPGQSKTGKNPKKQRVNKETIWQNKMDEVLNQVLETANLAIRKINESSQEVVTKRNENQCTINDQSMSNSNTNDQNDQSVSNFLDDQSISNEIESHHIFSDNEQQDLENDNEIDDFLSELPKIFEDDEKFGDDTNENIAKMVQSIVKKKSDVKSIIKELKIPSNCKDLSPPAVNSEIWHFLDRNIKTKDLGLQTVQKLLGHGIVPIIRMAEELKNKSPDSKKLKKCISDSLTVLMNAFFEISVNRRLLMKPFIDKRYHQLCNRTEKIGDNKLFDDVGKRLKDINDAQKINRNYFSKNFRGSRGNRMMAKPQSSYGQRGRYRTGQFNYTDQNKNFVRGSSRGRRNLRRGYYS